MCHVTAKEGTVSVGEREASERERRFRAEGGCQESVRVLS